MRHPFLVVVLIVTLAAVIGVFVGGVAGMILRRKLVALLKARHPLVLQKAQASPDVTVAGMRIASSSRLIRVVADAHIDDPAVTRVALVLRRCKTITLASGVILIAFMLGSKLNLW
jgi:hypothetical protein